MPERFSITWDELWRHSSILDIARDKYEFSHQKAEGVNKALPALVHMKPKASKFSEDGENVAKIRSISDNSPEKNMPELKMKQSF